VLSVLLRFTASDYPFGIYKLFFWPLCCLSFFDSRLLITPLVSTNVYFGHCVVCPSSIHASDYPFGIYKLLLAIVLSVLLRFTASDYPSGIYNLFLGTVNLHNKPSQCQNVNEFDLIFCCWCFQQYFSYIMATSFSGG
jgi:uncharacterized membrane protein (DUF485 family)